MFFVDCPKIPFWSVLSLNCCRFFKIYTSYIVAKCRSVKLINIPWFLVRQFYLLSVQSYKRLKLRAFKAWLFCKNQWKANLCRQNQYFRKRPYVHTSWAERYTCLLVKKIAFISSTEMIIPFHIKFLRLRHEKRCILWSLFLRCRHLMGKMRNLFLRCQCFNKVFSTKSKKEDAIYMGIIYMSFLSRNLLCKNIYTMSSFMWSKELFSILKWWIYLYCIFYLVC